MEHMAVAKHIPSGKIVDITGVYDGEWTCSNQWAEGDVFTITDVAELEGLWPNTEIVDTTNEFVEAFGVAHSYFMIAAITRNTEWAQTLLKVWADLY